MFINKFDNIYIILVLYKTSLEESVTIKSLLNIKSFNFEIMVYDNSPVKQYKNDNFSIKNINFTYLHNEKNPGLSFAYNVALRQAVLNNKEWLLLLDQDTLLNKEFICELKDYDNCSPSDNIVALVPQVTTTVKDRIISPTEMNRGGLCRPINLKPGIITRKMSGINSGTCLRVPFLESIKGFSNDYSLDMVDHWYFREIFKEEKQVRLLESLIKQDLSIYGKFEENVSIERYKQLIAAESMFITSEGAISTIIFKFRLCLRYLKQLRFSNKDYAKVTAKCLLGYNK